MKNLSKRTKIILSIISLVLIIALGVGIALAMHTYKDPIDQQAEVLPLGNYDYSKRPFFASELPTIYKGDIYWIDPCQWLGRVPLNELSCDISDSRYAKSEDMYFPHTYSICPDDAHNHNSDTEPDEDCLDYQVGQFLIDAYESDGGSPIIYRSRMMEGVVTPENEYGEIIRYDTGNMKGETLVSVSDAIFDVMTYDQWLFFTTEDAEGICSIHVISKKGGDITTLEVGKNGWSLMYADDNYVYYQDTAGNIYRATLDLQNPEFIYYAESISAMESNYIGTFIHNGYLYFEADYEIVPFYIGEDAIQFAKHSIRRVPLDNLYGENELVAENILDNYVFGVGNNVLYYQPCCIVEGKYDSGYEYYFDWTGGQLLGVNLDTLEQVDMINDIGLDINAQISHAQGNALFVHAFPTDGRYHRDRDDSSWGMLCFLYDTTTGALYPFCVNMFFFN